MISIAVENHSKRRGTLCAVIFVCLLAAAFGGWRVWRQTRLRQFGVVKDGVLYRSGQPSEEQLEALIGRYGIKTLINLRQEQEPYGEEFVKKHKLNLIHIPMGHSLPLSEEQISRFLSTVDDPKMQPALVHCSEGQTRSGAMVALYRIRRCDWSREQALEEMKRYGFNFAEAHKPLLESALADPDDAAKQKTLNPSIKKEPNRQTVQE